MCAIKVTPETRVIARKEGIQTVIEEGTLMVPGRVSRISKRAIEEEEVPCLSHEEEIERQEVN